MGTQKIKWIKLRFYIIDKMLNERKKLKRRREYQELQMNKKEYFTKDEKEYIKNMNDEIVELYNI